MSEFIAELCAQDEYKRFRELVMITPDGAVSDYQLAVLKEVTAAPHPSRPEGGVVFPATWASMVQLASEVSWTTLPGLQAHMASEMARRTTITPVTSATHFRPPDGKSPRPYQCEGAGVIAATGGGFVFDDPGTGKTLTTILGLLACRDRGLLSPAAPIVVVCPNSVIDSWVEAWHDWTTLRAVAWRGTAERRERLAGSADVYVVGYATAANDFDKHAGTTRSGRQREPLADLRAQAMVIDECHWIKNPEALRTQVIRKAAGKMPVVVALSGTPITHNAADLWPALYATDAASYPSRERFVRRYMRTVPGDYDDVVIGLNPHREPEFRLSLLGRYRSLRKADVLTQLPPKVYSVRTVEIPPRYRKAYDDMESDMLAQLDVIDPETGLPKELPAFTALAQLMRLNQMASAAADVEVEELEEVDELTGERKLAVHVHLKEPSWKIDALVEIIAERATRQSIVFAPSAQLIRLAGARLAKEGYAVGYVIGGQKPAERTDAVNSFQEGKLDVILASTQAGGVGITLTAADTVVFLQRPWSYVEASQAEDRAHRIGSEKHERIEIIDIVAKDTVETRVREVLRDKAKSLAELLEDPRIQRDVLGGLK